MAQEKQIEKENTGCRWAHMRVIKSSKISYKLHEKQFKFSISLLKFGVKLSFLLSSS